MQAKYVLTGSKWVAAAGSEIYAEGGQAYDYYAYYPYTEGVTNPTTVGIAARSDQSLADGANYGLSDVMASQNKTVAADAASIPLVFKHLFAMIEVKVTGDLVTKKPTSVVLKGVKLGSTFNLMSAAPTVAANAADVATDVSMYYLAKATDDTAVPFSYRAVVPAQAIVSGTSLVAINGVNAANKNYEFQYSADVTYEAGKYRQINVNIGMPKPSIEIPAGDMTIDPWGESDAIGGGGSEVIIPLIEKLGASLVEVMPDPTNLTENTWFGLKRTENEPNISYSIVDDNGTDWGKAAQLSYTSTWNSTTNKAVNNSWYIGTIGYLHSQPLDVSTTAIYKLTLKIKGITNEKGEIGKLVFTCRNAANSHSFLISAITTETTNKVTTVTKVPKEADTWEEFIVYIDFSKQSGTVGTINAADIATKVVDSTSADYAKFDLRIYTNGAATATHNSVTDVIRISDVVLEPYVAVP